MKEIVSHNNKWVRLIKKLKDRKYRDAEEMYVIEGPNLIEDALRNNEDIVLIGVTPNSLEYSERFPQAVRDRIFFFSQDIFDKLTDTVNPQNVIGVIRKSGGLSNIKTNKGGNRFVILDQVQDPGNAGTIIRTAEAAEFTGIIAVKGTVDLYSPKVVRAAAGSLFRINILEIDTREQVLDFTNNNKVVLYACDGDGKTEYTDADLKENVGIVVGNEGNGVSSFFLENCRTIRIPMKKETESLNAAVAAGIVIYESVRQRRI